ncbi:hypothetical protein RIF29_43332 [Crotalaria pallida]|uniref:Uncharacterized protein n=1 Tax=Crotalaria pallida TaxID=3830 RepID=A0AAN9DWZ6_CROPI
MDMSGNFTNSEVWGQTHALGFQKIGFPTIHRNVPFFLGWENLPNADFLSKGAINRSLSKGLVEGPSLGIKTSKADTHLYAWLPSSTEHFLPWRGIPDRLVNETYVSRHSSIYIYLFHLARLSHDFPDQPGSALESLSAFWEQSMQNRAMNLRKISSGL